MGIFRKQRFQCGGCGQAKTAKVTVPVEEAKDPLAPPPGWFVTNLTGQDPAFGAIASVSMFVCSEACGNSVAQGGGLPASQAFLTNFKAFLAGQGVASANTDVQSADDEDDEEYEDETPQFQQ